MSINCQALYDDARSTYGVGSGSDRLANRFVGAVNRSLDELSIAADLATKHSHITDTNDIITTLDSEYEWILFNGMQFYMTRSGQRPSDPNTAKAVYADTSDEWERAREEYVANRWNEKQADDATDDIIALGHLG